MPFALEFIPSKYGKPVDYAEYMAGDPVIGTVRVNVTGKPVKFKSLNLWVFGGEATSLTVRVKNEISHVASRANDRSVVLTDTYTLLGVRSDLLADESTEPGVPVEFVTLEVGEYLFPFHVSLPPSLFPTSEFHHADITYAAHVEATPHNAATVKLKVPLGVFAFVSLSELDREHGAAVTSDVQRILPWRGGVARMTVTLNRSYVILGEALSVHAQLDVRQCQKSLKSVTMRLLCVITREAKGQRKTSEKVAFSLKDPDWLLCLSSGEKTDGLRSGELVWQLPMDYDTITPSLNGKLITVEYTVLVIAKFGRTKLKVTLPVCVVVDPVDDRGGDYSTTTTTTTTTTQHHHHQ
eukprot:TRINITY_DN6911_c0_g1_i1.p2 TRINITY_DN6911_c0_g1~~TRINITY_DN6911_c0_g1_i1.p2  ORF type:complete len:352 (-),score=47.54 TRINITY_DN6911_c0_g1_i1:1311-2366(-)